ncbi:hypothetical protein PPERSA_04390 [Pseudocohnilembus persalinus]|uniref:Uncharacterized protein n=1 Tax=Pseudocohnilembus persalinus TaxID=266149 RepID=A0A0V0QQL5_PSEPJ|nr:hypothetical protein PPERSA_04390 [Pseudocohnilembus persalinus]|eukprot:KRX04575.1 hypothetical protein PPERSA_04390 [Pseudocohnilembus persalinus]
MQSVKSQKDKILKLGVKDKKLTRLFHNKQLTEQDSALINYIYEEKQSLSFTYGVMANMIFSIGTNFALFKTNGVLLQCVFFCSTFAGINFWVRKRVERRFNTLVDPYFEKYQIK